MIFTFHSNILLNFFLHSFSKIKTRSIKSQTILSLPTFLSFCLPKAIQVAGHSCSPQPTSSYPQGLWGLKSHLVFSGQEGAPYPLLRFPGIVTEVTKGIKLPARPEKRWIYIYIFFLSSFLNFNPKNIPGKDGEAGLGLLQRAFATKDSGLANTQATLAHFSLLTPGWERQ